MLFHSKTMSSYINEKFKGFSTKAKNISSWSDQEFWTLYLLRGSMNLPFYQMKKSIDINAFNSRTFRTTQ